MESAANYRRNGAACAGAHPRSAGSFGDGLKPGGQMVSALRDLQNYLSKVFSFRQ